MTVVVDHGSTKGVISIPCHKTIDATQTALNYIEHVFKRFGLPDSFLSDRGPQFSSQVFREIMRLLGVKTLRSTAYHPEGEEEFEVEAIIAHRKRGNGHQYLVKWKGYPHSNNTWEPTINLKGASEILHFYRTAQHL